VLDAATRKSIRKAIAAGDWSAALDLLGDDPERLHTVTTFGNWLHVAAAAG
jgi:uncharacterized protein